MYYSTDVPVIMRIILSSTNVPVEKPVENLLLMRIILNKKMSINTYSLLAKNRLYWSMGRNTHGACIRYPATRHEDAEGSYGPSVAAKSTEPGKGPERVLFFV